MDGLRHIHEDVWECGGIVPTFLPLTLDGGERSALHPNHFIQGKQSPVPTG
jgi:hypothetical protein